MNRMNQVWAVRAAGVSMLAVALCPSASARPGEEAAPSIPGLSFAESGQGMRPAKGFFVTDGEARLRISGWAQFRYLMNFREDPPLDARGNHDSGFASGFETAKTRLQAAGTVLDPNLRYRIEGEFSRTSGEFGLLDAWASYRFAEGAMEGVTLRGGQFKMPFLREQLLPDPNAITMERSVVDSVFNQGRSQGIDAQWTGERMRWTVGFGDGFSTVNTAYNSPLEADVALTARGEWKWGEGGWERFDDSPGWRGSSYVGMAGVALHWQHEGNTASPNSRLPFSPSQSDLFLYTADLTCEGDGWCVFGSFVGSHRTGDGGAPDYDDFGVVAQGGVFVSEHDEVFARWDTVFADGDRARDDPFSTLTVGVTHYFVPQSHALKLTGDVCWFMDPTTDNSLVATRINGRNGLLADMEGNQFCVRFQLQMMF